MAKKITDAGSLLSTFMPPNQFRIECQPVFVWLLGMLNINFTDDWRDWKVSSELGPIQKAAMIVTI